MSDQETIYPAFADQSYDPSRNTVAACAWNVPLLWFALFRPTDLVTRTFHTDDGPYVVTAPITTRQAALGQLAAAVARLELLFGADGPIREYATLLTDAIRSCDGRYATVEWDEIDVITEGGFLAEATAAMASLDPASPVDRDADRARLMRLSGIGRTGGRPFPPARYRLGLNGYAGGTEDDYLHSRILGASHMRPVPWEPPVAGSGRR